MPVDTPSRRRWWMPPSRIASHDTPKIALCARVLSSGYCKRLATANIDATPMKRSRSTVQGSRFCTTIFATGFPEHASMTTLLAATRASQFAFDGVTDLGSPVPI